MRKQPQITMKRVTVLTFFAYQLVSMAETILPLNFGPQSKIFYPEGWKRNNNQAWRELKLSPGIKTWGLIHLRATTSKAKLCKSPSNEQ